MCAGFNHSTYTYKYTHRHVYEHALPTRPFLSLRLAEIIKLEVHDGEGLESAGSSRRVDRPEVSQQPQRGPPDRHETPQERPTIAQEPPRPPKMSQEQPKTGKTVLLLKEPRANLQNMLVCPKPSSKSDPGHLLKSP